MEDLRNDSSLKPELNIKEFDDILTEILSNENTFNQLSSRIETLEVKISESSAIESRISNIESTILIIPNIVSQLKNYSEMVKKLTSEVESLKLKILEYSQATKTENVSKILNSDKTKTISPISSGDLALLKSTPSVSNIKDSPLAPMSENQDKCVSNVVFTHHLSPIFMDQQSPNSKGIAVCKNGIWEINLCVEILKEPPKSNTPNIPNGGYINYLNVQLPLNFSPKEVVNILGDRSGILFKTEEAILGYIYYAPEISVTYPHLININMILK